MKQEKSEALKQALRAVTPPVLWDAVRVVVRRFFPASLSKEPRGREQDRSWYDAIYDSSEEYRSHYTLSIYYFAWSVLADRLLTSGAQSVVDLGCGPGQLALLLYDQGLRRYCGVDFSVRAAFQARIVCPEHSFVVADVHDTNLLSDYNYDAVVCTEFIEHVEEDRDCLRRVRRGSLVFGSVPTFPDPGHVRTFPSEDAVRTRYADLLGDLWVKRHQLREKGSALFLFQGQRL